MKHSRSAKALATVTLGTKTSPRLELRQEVWKRFSDEAVLPETAQVQSGAGHCGGHVRFWIRESQF